MKNKTMFLACRATLLACSENSELYSDGLPPPDAEKGSAKGSYALNYPEGGYALISATRDYAPVLAYSDEGAFEITEDMGPVAIWLEETKAAIQGYEQLPEETKDNMRRMWDRLEMQGSQALPTTALRNASSMSDAYSDRTAELYYQYGPSGWSLIMPLTYASTYMSATDHSRLCSLAETYGSPEDYTIVVFKSAYQEQFVDSLLDTRWHQKRPYNRVSYPNDDYAIGCGVVAIAQVMKFHQYPQILTRNNQLLRWNNMNNYYDTNDSGGDVPYLMDMIKEISYTTHFINGSFTLTSKVDDTFRAFSYNASKRDHSADEVRAELLRQRPVLMYGSHTSLVPTRAHYWVCDGLNEKQYEDSYFVEFINPTNYTYSTKGHTSPTEPWIGRTFYGPYFHMNWGWQGNYQTWFFNNFVNPSYNFQYDRKDYYVYP